MGSRSAREGEAGPLRHPDGGQWGVDARLRLARDQRRLGRCVADVVAPGAVGPRPRQAPGDLPGQRAEELGATDAVLEADGPVRRLVGVGDPPGVLSAVPQQVQPDRAVLVGAGEEVEWGVTERPEGGPAMRPADEVEGPASDGETAPWCVPRRCSCPRQGDEGDRGTPGTFGDSAEIRHHHQTQSERPAGKVIAAGRLKGYFNSPGGTPSSNGYCRRIRPSCPIRRIPPTWGTHLSQTPVDRPPTGIRRQYPILLTPPEGASLTGGRAVCAS